MGRPAWHASLWRSQRPLSGTGAVLMLDQYHLEQYYRVYGWPSFVFAIQ